MNLSLYAIANDYMALVAKLEALGDNPDNAQAIADTIEGERYPVEQKSRAVAAYILNLEAEAAAYAEHARKINERAAAVQKKADGLRQYLLANMERCGITEIKPDAGTVGPVLKIRRNPPAVQITEPALVPPEFWKPPKAPEPDKAAIKAALQNGQELSFARLTQGNRLELS